MNCVPCLSPTTGNKGRCSSTTQLGRLERELEIQVKDSFQESQALQERFQEEILSVREDAERRLAERSRHAKRQQAKLKERISCFERHKADVLQQAELLQEQLVVATGEVRAARNRIFELESKVQELRSRPPQVVERAAPGMVVETNRLRDRAAAMEEQAKRAQRAASEAREAVGRESAVNQGFQRDVDNARHRLLTVQGSLAEAVEENTGLRRELEAERIKAAAGSRRLGDAVERQEAALAQIRHESAQVRDQRDSLAQDYAILGIKIRHLQKAQATRRIIYVLRKARSAGLSKGLLAWAVWVTNDKHAKKLARRQDEHVSEVQALEEDLRKAEGRCRDTRRRCEALRDSRETVAELVATACRRRWGMAAAAEERGAPALQWCFWGWARVTRGGDAAVMTRTKRVEAEVELPSVKERLREASERATGAENDRDQFRETAARMREEIRQSNSDLGSANAALDTMQSLTSTLRNRFIQHGATRVYNMLGRHRREQAASAFAWWVEIRRASNPHLEQALASSTLSSQTDGTGSKESPARIESRSRDITVPSSEEDVEVGSMQASCDGFKTTAVSRTGDIEPPTTRMSSRTAFLTKGAKTSLLLIGDGDNRADRLWSAAHNPEHSTPSAISVGSAMVDQGIAPQGAKYVVESMAESSSGTQASKTATVSVSRIPTGRPGTAENPWLFDAPFDRVRVVAARGISATRPETPEDDNGRGSASLARPESPVPTAAGTFLGVENQLRSDHEQSDSVCHLLATHDHPPPDLPRLMLSLRTAVGEELYAIGERLLRCVEADHREIHGKPYHPIALTGAERDQFRACLEDSTCRRLRGGVLAFLRAQESYRALAVERDRPEKHTVQACNDGGGWAGAGGRGGLRRTANTSKGKTRGARQVDKRDCGISSLTTGPLSSPAEKAMAARVLRDRLIALLEDADDAWATHRRPWRKLGAGTMRAEARGLRRRRATRNSGTRHIPNGSHEQGSSSSKLADLDSGAGPRKFWQTVAGHKFVEASWNIDIEVLEKQLWELAILVRQQECGEGLALRRCERLRRVLDLRVYEVLLLHVRTQIIWHGLGDDARVTLDGETSPVTDCSRDGRDGGREGLLGSAVLEIERAINGKRTPEHR